MKASAKRLLGFVGAGGAAGFALGGPPGAIVGALLGSLVDGAWSKARGEAMFGDEAQGVATIEEARFAKDRLKDILFNRPDVPWWLVGVGIGGQAPNYFVQVSVSGSPSERIPTVIQGVPVVVDATGAQSLEMSTGL